ncbi:MAG: hypothetical protein LBF22_04620 [Deltaproteobacteria bacterium]|jgi:hypothetical protein|nr:hypothetical protein [Deltaproteobacteria bacterium]
MRKWQMICHLKCTNRGVTWGDFSKINPRAPSGVDLLRYPAAFNDTSPTSIPLTPESGEVFHINLILISS